MYLVLSGVLMKKLYNKIMNFAFFQRLMRISFFEKILSYEFIIYVIFGVLTTAVNFAVSFVCNKIFGYGVIASFDLFSKTIDFKWVYVTNIIAWVCAVLFAYFTNKAFVFEVRDWSAKVVAREMLSFFAARVFSLVAFDLGFFALVENLLLKASAGDTAAYWTAKIAAAVFTVVFNYIFSKFMIFRKNREDKKDEF